LQERFIMARNPFSSQSAEDIVADLAHETVTRAMKMPPGVERERLLRMTGHDDVQSNLAAWAYSSGLQRPI
jgi:hypothetical protein